eukprot:CAMPEP_0116829664 /NCGR_PEP_ID=MMETSP0418-20121206/4339_1 /TAXON_ID=1158023 /ORGANISM="Astrosyne radiata, Strain 13vi08-1A" /LENGTH=214 /DNA_ID=CAMNT_0004458693 /DNA_START=830 /DNA_END=1474 /DNA_ORIENTATION=+
MKILRRSDASEANVTGNDTKVAIQSCSISTLEETSLCVPLYKNRFNLRGQPTLQDMAHIVNGDFSCVAVQESDMNYAAIISNIVAQTVALYSYTHTVDGDSDGTIRCPANTTVTRTGNPVVMEKDSSFHVVAEVNSIFIDLTSKLGIKERSKMARNLGRYEKLHEGTRDELEIVSQVEYIDSKLNLIQQNAKFFLEVLQNRHSDFHLRLSVLWI